MNLRTAIAALGIGAVALVASRSAQAEKDRYDPGEEIPVFTLKAINSDDSGESYVSVDKYYGAEAKTPKKAILLSFFATYCEPCKREMPFLGALYETYKEKGLQVLLVSIDKEADKIEEAKTLAAESGVKFPVLSDRFNIVAKRYFISKLPCVYIVNGDGKVSVVNVGYSGDVTKNLLDEVRKLIGEPAGDPVPVTLAKYMAHGDGAGGAGAGGDSSAAADAGTETAAADAASPEATDAAPPEDEGSKKKKRRKKKRKKKRRKKRK